MTEFEPADLPADCIADCSSQGAVDDAVAYWCGRPEIAAKLDSIPAEALRRCLKGYGAWDKTELADNGRNKRRILWLMCGTFADGQDWFVVE